MRNEVVCGGPGQSFQQAPGAGTRVWSLVGSMSQPNGRRLLTSYLLHCFALMCVIAFT